jgi:hypothetical protein
VRAEHDLLVRLAGAADRHQHVAHRRLVVGDVELEVHLGAAGPDVVGDRQAALERVGRLRAAEALEQRLRLAV